MLSNNHDMARENAAAVGEWIFQPGLYDPGGGIPYAWQTVATLSRFVSITFSVRANNVVDAAVAEVRTAHGLPLVDVVTPPAGYGAPRAAHLTNTELAALFAQGAFPVQKFGRTTGRTGGQVTSINTTVIVSYKRGLARFVNQIVVPGGPGFILPGDSGSLLVTREVAQRGLADGIPVGLLFAGNSDGSQALANRIEDVLRALSVVIDGD